jgi:DNA-binding CsgD family transcriptional regulator
MKSLSITRTENGYALNGLECVGLPRAQSHALLLRAQGRSFADAAEALGCSIQNVKNAIATLFYKLRADSSPELVTRAFESGFLRLLTLVAAVHLCAIPVTHTDEQPLRPRHQQLGEVNGCLRSS